MNKHVKKKLGLKRRHMHVRKKVNGSNECPRLCVYKSLKQIYVQAIDDDENVTIVSASSLEKDLQGDLKGIPKKDIAFKIGELIGARCKEKGLDKVVFDRGGFKYHGRIQALADGARNAGLNF